MSIRMTRVAKAFRTFYGDGDLIGCRVGPGDQVLLVIDMNSPRGRGSDIRTVWCGRVTNLDAVRAFRSRLLGSGNAGETRASIRDLDVSADPVRPGVKRVVVSVWSDDVAIECHEVSEE